MQVDPATIVVYSDIGCPWAHVAVHRLHATRARLGLVDEVVFDHRAFPLELFNRRPTPKVTLDAETPVTGAAEPEAGWQMWSRPQSHYPVTMLPALEAVQAAKEQGLRASEALDRALRHAFFGQSRTISMHHEILDIASGCPDLDVDVLDKALRQGSHRATVFEHYEAAQGDSVQGSPQFFLPDGTSVHNPGIEMHWEGAHGRGFPVIDADDPSIYERLIEAAAV